MANLPCIFDTTDTSYKPTGRVASPLCLCWGLKFATYFVDERIPVFSQLGPSRQKLGMELKAPACHKTYLCLQAWWMSSMKG